MARTFWKWWSAGRQSEARPPARRTTRRPGLESLEDRTAPAVLHVWQFGGSDFFGNGTTQAPFQSIQRAVNLANSGDTIQVAGGAYNYTAAQDVVFPFFGTNGVVSVVNKQLAIVGSFNPSNGWVAPDFTNTPSFIDPQHLTRGVFLSSAGGTPTGLAMSNFVIQNGNGNPIPARASVSPASAINGYGGGILAETSTLILDNIAFVNNLAVGANTNSVGGTGAGGGLGIFSASTPAQLSNLIFFQNTALGANGAVVGGFGQGGGLFSDLSTVNGTNLQFGANVAQGGSTPQGPGIMNNATGDGFGGAINFEQLNGNSALVNVLADQNRALGGLAPAGIGGGGFGGGIGVEQGTGTLTIQGGTITNNVAQGGTGPVFNALGNLGAGGGVQVTNANLIVSGATISGNTAAGGTGGQFKAGPAGGGLQAVSTLGVANAIMIVNSTIANNTAAFGTGSSEQNGGAGGGASFNGNTVTISGSTFDANQFANSTTGNLQGQAIAANSPSGIATTLTITGSTIRNHTNNFNPPAAAIHVFAGNTATLQNVTFQNNTHDTNADGVPFGNPGRFIFQ